LYYDFEKGITTNSQILATNEMFSHDELTQLTSSGELIVNSVSSSCYAIVNPIYSHIVFAPVRLLKKHL
jgi:hypothetical protein